jgi:hypothetical protein
MNKIQFIMDAADMRKKSLQKNEEAAALEAQAFEHNKNGEDSRAKPMEIEAAKLTQEAHALVSKAEEYEKQAEKLEMEAKKYETELHEHQARAAVLEQKIAATRGQH